MTESEEAGQSEAFVASSLSVSLTADDLHQTVAWYRDAVGFRVEQKFEREGHVFAVRLSAGSILILITQDNGAKGGERTKGEGISLRLITPGDIDQLAKRILDFGHSLDSEPEDQFGARAFRVRDPNGIRILFSAEPRAGNGR